MQASVNRKDAELYDGCEWARGTMEYPNWFMKQLIFDLVFLILAILSIVMQIDNIQSWDLLRIKSTYYHKEFYIYSLIFMFCIFGYISPLESYVEILYKNVTAWVKT